ncbi:Osmosensitive K+ channel histidine kinase KdpD [Fulvivirga imtechensis AK7]|uniref:histidine kinase n=2 Tax=Fulvivirga TaxID=396811 RepID=M0QSS6_9BACT|nr:Osmosensitive K+ channel histidine kinase KdpD [Fulvivirga imtechensis AK7]
MLIVLVTITCYFLANLIGYREVALVLLLVVSILAMLFDIFPVLTAAVLSALIWNYFFIPPTHTFHVGTPEDVLLFLMYFVIALINIVLTSKIRNFERKARDKEGREKTITLYNTLINSLSHELRTPISTIVGAVDTIRENDTKLSEEDKAELINEIEIAGFRLNRQVENLLNMSRLEAGVLQPKLDWCDVNELMHTVIRNYRDSATDYKIYFEQNENLPLFKIDRGLIEQALNNILHNALHYTPKGSSIELRVFQSDSGCVFSISDNGKGISESDAAFIFDKFYRGARFSTGGSGLGLSIAKGFTEAHNGTIRLKNKKAGGAEFIIELPAKSMFVTDDELKDEQG